MSKLSYATLYIRIHFHSARIFHLKCLLGYYINVTIDVTFEVRIYISLWNLRSKWTKLSACLQIPGRRAVRTRRASAASAARVATKAAADPTGNRRGCARFSTRSSCTPSEPATPRIRGRTLSWRSSSSRWPGWVRVSSGCGSRTRGAKTRRRRSLWSSRCKRR